MSIKRALNKESSYEIASKFDEKCSRGISYSSQIVFFQSLHYTCFSSAICPLQVPDQNGLFALLNFLVVMMNYHWFTLSKTTVLIFGDSMRRQLLRFTHSLNACKSCICNLDLPKFSSNL